jgi:hypothetical protein
MIDVRKKYLRQIKHAMYSIIKMRKKKKLGLGLRNDWQLKLR